jgi:hypothetical protein
MHWHYPIGNKENICQCQLVQILSTKEWWRSVSKSNITRILRIWETNSGEQLRRFSVEFRQTNSRNTVNLSGDQASVDRIPYVLKFSIRDRLHIIHNREEKRANIRILRFFSHYHGFPVFDKIFTRKLPGRILV